MDLGIKGKVALVAASSKGIGKAIAFALADEGVNLSIFSRSKDEIERTASEIRTHFTVDALASAADVTSKEQVDQVIETTVQTFGGIDILINNAGVPILRSGMSFSISSMAFSYSMPDWAALFSASVFILSV